MPKSQNVINFLIIVICLLAVALFKAQIQPNANQEPTPTTQASSYTIELPTNTELDSEQPNWATSNDAEQSAVPPVELPRLPANILTSDGSIARICSEMNIYNFCPNPSYDPWSLVACEGKDAPEQTTSGSRGRRGPDDSPVKYINCDEPLSQTAWIIEPLHARLRYGPGRNDSTDNEVSMRISWWMPIGRVVYKTQVQVLGCFMDQTVPQWSRTTLLDFAPPIDAHNANAWVYIRFIDENGKTDYGWVHNITLSSNTSINNQGQLTTYEAVCRNYLQ